MSEYKATLDYKVKINSNDNDTVKLAKLFILYGDQIAEEINYELAKIQYNIAKSISKSAVDYFYGSYPEPHLYDRKGGNGSGGLYEVVDIGIKNGQQFVFAFDSSFMGSHRSNEAVYELDFKQGYHGGKRWRNPPFATEENPVTVFDPETGKHVVATHPWQYWHPAKVPVTNSPYNIIVTNWNHYIDNRYEKDKERISRKVMSKYINKVG